jgi:hypothetical protein
MKCPLLREQYQKANGNWEVTLPNCPEGECAWWDRLGNQCLAQTMVWSCERLLTVLKEISARMQYLPRP